MSIPRATVCFNDPNIVKLILNLKIETKTNKSKKKMISLIKSPVLSPVINFFVDKMKHHLMIPDHLHTSLTFSLIILFTFYWLKK